MKYIYFLFFRTIPTYFTISFAYLDYPIGCTSKVSKVLTYLDM